MKLRDQAARLRAGAGTVEESIHRACASIDAQDGRIQALLPEPRRLERLLAEARALAATPLVVSVDDSRASTLLAEVERYGRDLGIDAGPA